MSSILTTQFRMTLHDKKSGRRVRPPRDPDFPLALDFLYLRTHLTPALQPILEEWKESHRYPHRRHPRRYA